MMKKHGCAVLQWGRRCVWTTALAVFVICGLPQAGAQADVGGEVAPGTIAPPNITFDTANTSPNATSFSPDATTFSPDVGNRTAETHAPPESPEPMASHGSAIEVPSLSPAPAPQLVHPSQEPPESPPPPAPPVTQAPTESQGRPTPAPTTTEAPEESPPPPQSSIPLPAAETPNPTHTSTPPPLPPPPSPPPPSTPAPTTTPQTTPAPSAPHPVMTEPRTVKPLETLKPSNGSSQSSNETADEISVNPKHQVPSPSPPRISSPTLEPQVAPSTPPSTSSTSSSPPAAGPPHDPTTKPTSTIDEEANQLIQGDRRGEGKASQKESATGSNPASFGSIMSILGFVFGAAAVLVLALCVVHTRRVRRGDELPTPLP